MSSSRPFVKAPKQQAGFTLIEVMVAVAILGVALPALLFSMISQVESSAHLRKKLESQWVAQNILTEIRIYNRITGGIAAGKDNGKVEFANQTWYWRSRSKEFPQDQLKSIYGVEIAVYDDKDAEDDNSLGRLTAIVRNSVPSQNASLASIIAKVAEGNMTATTQQAINLSGGANNTKSFAPTPVQPSNTQGGF